LKVLFDHNVNSHFRRHLPGHDIKTAREMRWDKLANGKLLRAAADMEFGAVVSVDKNLRHEQNLSRLPLPVLVLDSLSNALADLIPFSPHVQLLLNGPLQNLIYMVGPDGQIRQFGSALKD
jgi:hypothetical protein